MISRNTKLSTYITTLFFRGGLAVLGGALLFAVAAQPLLAQGDVKVNVGIAAAKPGDPIDIPLTLSGGENASVGSLVVHLSYPKKLLTYTDLERGLAVELADGEVKATVADDKSDASQTAMEFTANGKNPIKPGILGYLKFNVSNDATKGIIVLKLKDTKATSASGANVQLAKGDDGQLTIFASDEQIPVVGCFFFTH